MVYVKYDPDNINIRFGELLRKYRKAKNMTQIEFAKYCFISRAYYGRVERGEHSLRLDKIEMIAQCLEISISELFSELLE